MFIRLELPYTCNAKCTRILQENMHKSYTQDNSHDYVNNLSQQLPERIFHINSRIADNISLFISHGSEKHSRLIKQRGIFGMKRVPDAKEALDSLQAIRASVIGKRYNPWSDKYTLDWGKFCQWFNELKDEQQTQAEDYFELVAGISVRELFNCFAKDIVHHCQSGQSFYPLPSYSEHTKKYERPDLIAGCFSIRFREIEKIDHTAKTMNLNPHPFDDSWSDWGAEEKEEERPPYEKIELGVSASDYISMRTLAEGLDYILMLNSESVKNRLASITMMGESICTLKIQGEHTYLDSIDLKSEVIGEITKDTIIKDYRAACQRNGIRPNLTQLLNVDLSL